MLLGVLAGCGSTADVSAPTTTTSVAPTTTAMSTVPPTAVKPRPAPPPRISGPVAAFGDSLMLGAAPALRELIPTIDIDAAVSRSALPVPSILRTRAGEGRLPPWLVLDLALNGGVSSDLLDDVLAIAAGRRVVMLTARCPYCTYTAAENATIRSECTPQRNCRVADWERLANAHPEWFATDGVHMSSSGRGAHAYAELVHAELTRPS